MRETIVRRCLLAAGLGAFAYGALTGETLIVLRKAAAGVEDACVHIDDLEFTHD